LFVAQRIAPAAQEVRQTVTAETTVSLSTTDVSSGETLVLITPSGPCAGGSRFDN
jgi:hypothetical protein